jgi:hypothetical protein
MCCTHVHKRTSTWQSQSSTSVCGAPRNITLGLKSHPWARESLASHLLYSLRIHSSLGSLTGARPRRWRMLPGRLVCPCSRLCFGAMVLGGPPGGHSCSRNTCGPMGSCRPPGQPCQARKLSGGRGERDGLDPVPLCLWLFENPQKRQAVLI